MPGKNYNEVVAAAERVHGESDNLPFLAEQLKDLVDKGVNSEAFKIAMELKSPLDQFAIHPIIDFHIGNFYIFLDLDTVCQLLAFSFLRVACLDCPLC